MTITKKTEHEAREFCRDHLPTQGVQIVETTFKGEKKFHVEAGSGRMMIRPTDRLIYEGTGIEACPARTKPKIDNLDELAADARRFAIVKLKADKPMGEPWGVYFETTPEGQQPFPILTTEFMNWVKWLVRIHNAALDLIAFAESPLRWTLTPEWQPGMWIARRATQTTMMFWDGQDEPPSLPGSLPTYWLGPIENPPF